MDPLVVLPVPVLEEDAPMEDDDGSDDGNHSDSTYAPGLRGGST